MISLHVAVDDPPRRRGWLSLIVAYVAYTLAMCVIVWLRAESTTDFRDFWETGRRFLERGEITDQLGVHNYLPFFVIFMSPWSWLPLHAAIVLFTLLSLGVFALTVVMVETLLCGELPRRPRPAMLAVVGLMLPYVTSCAVLGAVGLLLLFLVVATWFLIERRREWLAGVALGLAILIKLLPAVLLPFLIFRGRWRAVVASAGVCLVLGLGWPLALLGYHRTVDRHASFYHDALRGHSAIAAIHAEKPLKANYSNNALPIVLRRLLSPVNAGKENQQLFVNLANLPTGTIAAVFSTVLAIVLLATAAVSLQPAVRLRPRRAEDVSTLRAGFGAWCCLMLLASPLVWTHYLPLVYWPLALLAHRVERSARQRHVNKTCVSALLAWLLCAALLVWPTARAAGAQLVAVFVLWLVAVLESVRANRPRAGS